MFTVRLYFYFILCIWVFSLHICLCSICVLGVHRGQKTASNPLWLELLDGCEPPGSARIEGQVSGIAVSDLKHWAIYPNTYFYKYFQAIVKSKRQEAFQYHINGHFRYIIGDLECSGALIKIFRTILSIIFLSNDSSFYINIQHDRELDLLYTPVEKMSSLY